MNIEALKMLAYNKLIESVKDKNIGYGHISSKLITDIQLNYLKRNYLVVNTGRFGGSRGTFYMVCKV
jgi:hypothetical protein